MSFQTPEANESVLERRGVVTASFDCVTAFSLALLVPADHFHKNICSALRVHHDDADEEPRVGHHVEPHCTYQRAALQQRGAGAARDRGVPAAGHHGDGPPLHDGQLPCKK